MRQFKPAVMTVMLLLLLSGCAGKVKTTTFLHPEFDFSFVERVAVLPFENLTADREAGARATRLTVTELLASGAVSVIETGEIGAAIVSVVGVQPSRGAAPSTEQVIALGKELDAQALILGTVTQSEVIRSGTVGLPVVTIDLRMIETDTGATIWASTHTEQGSSASAKVFGTGGEPISQTTRRCVQKLLEGLVD